MGQFGKLVFRARMVMTEKKTTAPS